MKKRYYPRTKCGYCDTVYKTRGKYCSDFCRQEAARERSIDKLIEQEALKKEKGLLEKDFQE